jgi:signal peptidase I
MNIQQLRESLKIKWLNYYFENRPWLVKMQIWGTYDGQRRPSSGFMLATLSVLEPQLDEIFAFIVDLNSNPDRIVAALGLNFNPDRHLDLIKSENSIVTTEVISDAYRQATQPLPEVRDPVKNEVETNTNEALVTTEVKNNDKFQVESKNKSKPSGFTTKVETRVKHDNKHSKTSSSNLSPWRKEAKKSVAVLPGDIIRMNGTCERSHSVSKQLSRNGKPLAVATIESQAKGVKMQRKDVQSQVNSSPTNARNLPSWIDEFCKGVV